MYLYCWLRLVYIVFSSDPLPSAVLLAFKAIRMHVVSGKSTPLSEFMQLCETASGFLKQSVALPLTTDGTIDDELTKVLILLNMVVVNLFVYSLFSLVNCMLVIGCSVYNRSSGKPVKTTTK